MLARTRPAASFAPIKARVAARPGRARFASATATPSWRTRNLERDASPLYYACVTPHAATDVEAQVASVPLTDQPGPQPLHPYGVAVLRECTARFVAKSVRYISPTLDARAQQLAAFLVYRDTPRPSLEQLLHLLSAQALLHPLVEWPETITRKARQQLATLDDERITPSQAVAILALTCLLGMQLPEAALCATNEALGGPSDNAEAALVPVVVSLAWHGDACIDANWVWAVSRTDVIEAWANDLGTAAGRNRVVQELSWLLGSMDSLGWIEHFTSDEAWAIFELMGKLMTKAGELLDASGSPDAQADSACDGVRPPDSHTSCPELWLAGAMLIVLKVHPIRAKFGTKLEGYGVESVGQAVRGALRVYCSGPGTGPNSTSALTAAHGLQLLRIALYEEDRPDSNSRPTERQYRPLQQDPGLVAQVFDGVALRLLASGPSELDVELCSMFQDTLRRTTEVLDRTLHVLPLLERRAPEMAALLGDPSMVNAAPPAATTPTPAIDTATSGPLRITHLLAGRYGLDLAAGEAAIQEVAREGTGGTALDRCLAPHTLASALLAAVLSVLSTAPDSGQDSAGVASWVAAHALAQQVASMTAASVQPAHVLAIVWAAAVLRLEVDETWLEAVLGLVAAHSAVGDAPTQDVLDPPHVQLLIWSLSELQKAREQGKARAQRTLLSAAGSATSSMRLVQGLLGGTGAAEDMLRGWNPAAVTSAADGAAPALAGLALSGCVTSLWCLARAQAQPDAAWLVQAATRVNECIDEAARQADNAAAQDAVLAVGLLQELGLGRVNAVLVAELERGVAGSRVAGTAPGGHGSTQ